jgi:excinuclease ABC subunit C
VISLAKRFEEIYRPGSNAPIRLEKKNPALKLLMRIRNEAHRFAVNYHRLLRSKRMIGENE